MLSKILAFVKKSRPVTYDRTFFDVAWFENWNQLKHVLFTLLQLNPHWRSILDFGCGPGVMIDFMNAKGYEYYGWDSSEEARQLYFKHFGLFGGRYFQSWDQCSERQFDLFLAFDVFEHMNDESIIEVLQLVQHTPELMVNISRSRSTPGHINIKSDRQWICFFKQNGWSFAKESTENFRTEYLRIKPQASDLWHRNLFVFSR